tara:strand:- start:2053 stop:2865 length:813 start_codon:yes stop_codon:yes gene_type:complete
MSYYDVLGVSDQAPAAEIKKAYRELSKQHHPDMSGGDESRFKEISEAYEHLSNDVKRAQYDASRMNPFSNMGGNGFAFDGNFADMFNQHFGGDPRKAKGHNHTIIANIPFVDGYNGASRQFNVNGETIKINIPKGVQNGANLRVAGKGQINPYNPSAGPGDLIIQIQIQQDANFILRGNDICIDYGVHWLDLILGTKIDVTLPDGHIIKVPVPVNSFHHKSLRIKDTGYPIYNTSSRGSLIIRLNSFYNELNDEQLEAVNKLKDTLSGLE